MKTYNHIRCFNPDGMDRFVRIMEGSDPVGTIDPEDDAFSQRVQGTTSLEVATFSNRRELAKAVCKAFGPNKPEEFQDQAGIWAWLTWVLREEIFERHKNSDRLVTGEPWTWKPASPRNFQKAQRHKVRMPVVTWSTLGHDADHLLCGSPKKSGELLAQLTSQQDMLAPAFQKLCRMLYYDKAQDTFRRGAGGSGVGSARHLARVRKQLDITWDFSELDTREIFDLLPKEFGRFLD
jgi:hypothetical protein